MIDLQLFKNVIAEGRHNSDLLDSYSPNQFKTKERLIGHVRDLNVVNEQSEITILGGWYGSILIPAFKEAKRISLIDIDKNATSIGKQRLFKHYNNVDFITSDVFDKNRYGRIRYANLVINTSCEHMNINEASKKLFGDSFTDPGLSPSKENKFDQLFNDEI